MNLPAGKPYKACECGRLTSLPFMCRACWSALGHERQVSFYRAISHHTPAPRRGMFS